MPRTTQQRKRVTKRTKSAEESKYAHGTEQRYQEGDRCQACKNAHAEFVAYVRAFGAWWEAHPRKRDNLAYGRALRELAKRHAAELDRLYNQQLDKVSNYTVVAIQHVAAHTRALWGEPVPGAIKVRGKVLKRRGK